MSRERNLLNVRQVEAFRAAALLGSMTRAADQVGVSQPAVSKLIAALESRIGFALFERLPGGLRLTPEGRHFLEDVEGALIGVQALTEKAEDIRTNRTGRLNMGAMPALSHGFCQRVIAGFLQENPGSAMSLHTRSTPQLVSLVQARQLDLAVLAYLGPVPLVEIEMVHRTAMVCVVPAGHRLETRECITAADIATERFIALSNLDQIRPRVELALRAEGVRPPVRLDTGLSASACHFVAEGLGITISDPFSVAAVGQSGIVARPFLPRIDIEIAIIRPSEPGPSRLAQAMIDRLRAALQNLDAA